MPDFSNRDRVFNDLSAPGVGIFSTLPRDSPRQPGCPDQGYSACGTDDFAHAEGTSFAAPQVSAAAADLFAADPAAHEQPGRDSPRARRPTDVNATNGCPRCGLRRDLLSGWGRLDVAKAVEALAGPLPPPDSLETNDDAGTQAPAVWGKSDTIAATVDYWDDPVDVYKIVLEGHEQLRAQLTRGGSGRKPQPRALAARDGARRPAGLAAPASRSSRGAAGGSQHLSFRAPGRGWYYLEVARRPRPDFTPTR